MRKHGLSPLSRFLHTLFFGGTTFSFLLALLTGEGPLVLTLVGLIGSACGLFVAVMVED